MTQQKIELAKAREFGELITDTFVFIKENFKPLIKAFLIFSGFFIVALMVTQSIQQITLMDLERRARTDPDFNNYFQSPFARFGLQTALGMLFMFLSYTTMTATVLCYMSLYKEKSNTAPTIEELWVYIKYFFLRILGSTFLLSILLMIGFALCLVPGFWLAPILGLVFPIMVFENAGFGYAFNRSFNLISNNWWLTFGTMVVMSIIVYMGIMLFSIPSYIITAINFLLHTSSGFVKSPVVIIATTILRCLGVLLYILPVITSALCYFNLNEIKEGTGLIDRINRFGTQTDTNSPAEEY
jgi:hypothetical protein